MIEAATSSGSIAVTAGVQKVTGPGVMTFAEITGGSAAGTLTVYDGTSTGGTVLVNLTAAIGAVLPANLAHGVVFNTGLYVVVSGTGSTGVVHFRLG